MTFKVTILGSSAAMPMAGRNHSAHALNVHEQFYLVDCGEGTQNRLRQFGINPMKINAVFISHLHGDHMYGLFPLISTLGLMGRKTPLKIFAPAPFGQLMACMSECLGESPDFELQYHRVDTRKNLKVFENNVMEVWSIPLRHRIPSAGYLFREKVPPLNVRKQMIGRYGLGIAQVVAAKRGEDVTLETGEIVSNAQLTYVPYQPRSYAYCSDTSYSGKVMEIVTGVDLLYHEATFAAADKKLAKQTGHSTSVQAAKVALGADVGRLLLGHFSGRYKDPSLLVEQARELFARTDAVVEGETIEIPLKRNC